MTLNTTYYNIWFNLYDLNLHIIFPDQYEFRLNGTIEDFGMIYDLQTDDYTISIVDRFGISLFNSVITLRGLNEYRIDITLYELQIRHLGRVNSNLTLNETTGHVGLNFSMAPNTITNFILGSSTYNVTWINGENNVVTIYDINLNTDYILTLNSTYYSIWFSLYNQGGVRLGDSLFSLYLNGTRKDFGLVELETSATLILVQDYLNVTVFNQVITLRGLTEYNVIITVFEFQVRHLTNENSNITLFETTTHNYINFSMSPDSLRSFMLANSTYNITWINGENSVSTFYNITLDEDYILTLDTTYYPVYFALFNFDGLGLDPNLFRFYINNLRKDFGFNTLKQNTNNLKVLDYFNQSLFDSNIGLSGSTEYNILIEVYTMIIYNNYSFPVIINIERNEIEFEQIIEAGLGFDYRMLPNVEYSINIYRLNGTLLETREVDLDENNKIVSFGFFTTELPYDPEPLVFDFTVLLAFVVILSVGGWIVVIAWAYMKNDRDMIPKNTRKKYNKKWKAGTFQDRGI